MHGVFIEVSGPFPPKLLLACEGRNRPSARYVYAREHGPMLTAILLMMDEARRVASNIAKLPMLLRKRHE
jgi:hypothetical protein